MKVFISLKVPRGDAELIRLADLIGDLVRQAGHLPLIATYEIANQGLTDPKDFMPVVREIADDSDLMIVLYHPELRGGLIELGLAYAKEIPIWLCYKFGERVSSSAIGCADLIIQYTNLNDLQLQLSTNLRKFPLVEKT
jgi:hypothetical protein